VSHSDQNLIEAVRQGRKSEFEKFAWSSEPPDPQSPDTFSASMLHWERREEGAHRVMLEFYKYLLRIRREIPVLANLDKNRLDMCAIEHTKMLIMRRWLRHNQITALFHLGNADSEIPNPLPPGKWKKILDSSDPRWNGPGCTLPDHIMSEKTLTIRNSSAAVFQGRT